MLPEVTEPRNWSNNQFPFLDKDRTIVGMISLLQRFVAFNKDQVKTGEIKGYRDLLKPAYKGKITLNDPGVTGQGNALMGHLGMHIWNPDQAKDYLRQIVVDQQAVIQRDNNLHVESVARGKYAIALAPAADVLYRFIGLNAPIEAVLQEEGAFISTGSGAFAVSTKLAHPNATAVFVNWLLGKEGQTVFARGFGNPSLRNDVSTEGFVSVSLPQPGEKIFLDSEEAILFRGQMLGVARQIIDEAKRQN